MTESNSLPTIVVIDGDSAVRTSLKFSLEIEGYLVRTYSSAFQILTEDDFPDVGCMVVDHRLPDIDGLELIFQLRRRNILLPAILVVSQPDQSVYARAAGASVPIVEKPFLTTELYQCIQMLLTQK